MKYKLMSGTVIHRSLRALAGEVIWDTFTWSTFVTTKDAYYNENDLKPLTKYTEYYYCILPPSALPWRIVTFSKQFLHEI